MRQANEEFARHYPGETGRRQPVHTVYGGAHLFKADSAKRLGSLAQRALDQFAPDFLTFARALNFPGADQLPESMDDAPKLVTDLEKGPEPVRRDSNSAWLAHTIYNRVSEKLQREPVEDFRIDFEDGYGNRPDDEEDGHAAAAAGEVVPRDSKKERCRRSSASVSNRSTKSCARAVFARSTFLSRLSLNRTTASCQTTSS